MSVEYEEVTVNDKTFKVAKPKFNDHFKNVSAAELDAPKEKAKKYWKHKPYKCDMGGAKDETL